MELNGDPEQENVVDGLEKWFEENPELPSKIDRIFLKRIYLLSSKNIEETKKFLLLNYALRNESPTIFLLRDSMDEDTRNTAALFDYVPLPGLTPEKYRVVLMRLKDPNPKMLHFKEDIKTYFMANDCRFSMPDIIIDNTPLLAQGVIQIVDIKGGSLRHLTRTSIAPLRIFAKFSQEASPVRLTGLHFLNSPSFARKMFAIVKPLTKKHFQDMMHFHNSDSETIYDFVPQDMFPEEYGGKAGKISDLSDDFMKTLREKRDYLMDPSYWKIVKS